MTIFTQVILYTDIDGRAKFREESVPLGEGSPQAMLSALFPSGGFQLRQSPVGFRSQFHCSPHKQWVFIMGGEMEIGLQDGTSRIFRPGQHFYSADRNAEFAGEREQNAALCAAIEFGHHEASHVYCLMEGA